MVVVWTESFSFCEMSGGKKTIQHYYQVKPSEERARQLEHEDTNGAQVVSETDGSQNEAAQSSELPTMSPCVSMLYRLHYSSST